MSARPWLIDIHHHAMPDTFARALPSGVPLPGVDYPAWTADRSLEVMDRNAIAASVLSITAPGIHFGDAGATRRVAREVNESFAGIVAEHPTRFGAFAVLPLPDPAASKEELAYALDELKLDGVGLFSSYGDRYLGDPEFEPVLAELAERGVPVHVHPMSPPAKDVRSFDLPPSLYDFVFETTRTVASLLFNGVLDRLPDLKLILSHAGGSVPFLAKRLTYGPTIGAHLKDRQPADLIGSLRRLHYDTAMSANEFALPTLDRLVDPTRILFGSDFPFMKQPEVAESVAGILAHPGWNDEQRLLVERGNALRLFPGLARRLTAAEGNTR
ncbi:amidohydrolase family protein [Streptomyces purpureus]|uniref:Amidohydrolase n=1 Tax=Streptomyces purpureus TaxID=1951 RepID=A0A918H4B9_9ACTN|nr:amidohydrolase family protein [Streptomyces purpureus]GGT36395.1 amidohydrolase [Streptomyces purpureus]